MARGLGLALGFLSAHMLAISARRRQLITRVITCLVSSRRLSRRLVVCLLRDRAACRIFICL